MGRSICSWYTYYGYYYFLCVTKERNGRQVAETNRDAEGTFLLSFVTCVFLHRILELNNGWNQDGEQVHLL